MSRWRVERGFGWVAMLLDKQGREINGTAKRFATHAEAIAYADQMSRTVEVELPRVKPLEDIPIGNYITLSDPGPCIFFINGRGGEYICINDDEIKPLALALLAHARKEKQ